MSDTVKELQGSQCGWRRGWKGGNGGSKGGIKENLRKRVCVTHMFITMIVVMVSRVYTYGKIYTVHLKHVQFILCQFNLKTITKKTHNL